MKNKVKVLQIGMTRHLGGIETFLMNQFLNINHEKFHYDFVNITGEYSICFEKDILEKSSKIYNIVSRGKNPLKHYLEWFSLLIKEYRNYDAIVLNANTLEYIFPLFLAKIFGIKLRVIHSHSTGTENNKNFLRKCLVCFNKLLLSYSANIYFACSNKAAEWMFKDKQYFVIPNAFNTESFKYNKSIRESIRTNFDIKDDLVLLNVGRFAAVKNHLFIIDVFNEVCKVKPNSKLILVTGSLEEDSFYYEMLSKIERYNLLSKVKIIRMSNDIPSIMSASDIFLLPSLFEGFGNVAIESQAAGLPTIISMGVPEEVIQTDLVHRVPLDIGAEKWAKIILSIKPKDRIKPYKLILDSDYNIKNSINKLENIFIKSLNDNYLV